MFKKLKLLLIGSITNSAPLYSDGIRKRFGGGVMYGSFAAIDLGIDTRVITIGAKDIEPAVDQLRHLGIDASRLSRRTSNNFANDYTTKQRKLQMSSFIDKPITKDEMSGFDLAVDGVVLNPLYHEISADIIALFPKKTVIMLDIQGLTRRIGQRNDKGYYPVFQTGWKNIGDFSGKIDILKSSDDDIRGTKIKNALNNHGFPLVVLTRGKKTTRIFQTDQRSVSIPVYKVAVRDTAGAGDYFGIAYLSYYLVSKDPIASCRFANAVSSLKVEGKAITLSEAKRRMEFISSI